MPQPRWQNIQAPNFADTSRILESANRSLNAGLSSASSLLEKYQDGKRQKNDSEVTTALAGIQDEAGLQKYLQSGALDGKDLSPELRQDILDFRSTLLQQETRRATNRNVDAQTANTTAQQAINQAVESRRVTTFDRGTEKYNRAEDRRLSDLDLADEIVNSTRTAKNIRKDVFDPKNPPAFPEYGKDYKGADLENGIYNGLRDRGIDDHIARGFMTNFKDESNFDSSVNEKNLTVKGSRGGFGLYQLTGDRRVEFEKFAKDTGQKTSSIDAQLDFMVSELGGKESAAYKKIQQAQSPEEAASLIATHFLRPSDENLSRRTNNYSAGKIWEPKITDGKGNALNQIEDNDAEFEAQVIDLQEQMLAAGYTGDEINKRIAGLYKTKDAAVSKFTKEQKKQRNEKLAGNYLDQIQNSKNLTVSDLVAGALEDPIYETNAERIAAAERLTNLGKGIFSDVLRPNVADDSFSLQSDIIAAEEQNRRQNNPQRALFDTAKDFSADPVGKLMSDLQIGKDGQNKDLIGQRDELDEKIKELSQEKSVSPAIAAVALRETFVRDPLGPDGGFVTSDTYRRFPKKDAAAFIDAMLSQEHQFTFDAENIISKDNEVSVKKMNSELKRLRSQAKKYKGDIPAELSIKIAQLQNQIANF